jgi:AcrR family transcriptional regulator
MAITRPQLECQHQKLCYGESVVARTEVTPNRRGLQSRESVLDAAERLMAEHGYDGASVARLRDESGIPASSVYHYFGSKDGVLLAVMERGANRFFASLPDMSQRHGRPAEHLRRVVETVGEVLNHHPNFLRLLVVMAAQPPAAGDGKIHAVVNRVRDEALRRLREQMQLAFGLDPHGEAADRLSRFALAAFDGAFVAQRADSEVSQAEVLEHLPAALVAMRRELAKRSG